jgi:hypothetical protein
MIIITIGATILLSTTYYQTLLLSSLLVQDGLPLPRSVESSSHICALLSTLICLHKIAFECLLLLMRKWGLAGMTARHELKIVFEEPGTLAEEGLRQNLFGRALVTNAPVYFQELGVPLSTALKTQSLIFIGDSNQVKSAECMIRYEYVHTV